MNVTDITTEDFGFGRTKVTFRVSPSLEDMSLANGSTYEVTSQLVGRKYRISLIPRSYGTSARRSSDYYARTRFYVSTPDGIDLGMPQPRWTRDGEDPDNDKAWRKYNRLELEAVRTLIGLAMPIVRAVTIGLLGESKVSFSRKAGCSCGCSPGFKADTVVRFLNAPCDVWVEEYVDENEAAHRKAVREAEQAERDAAIMATEAFIES